MRRASWVVVACLSVAVAYLAYVGFDLLSPTDDTSEQSQVRKSSESPPFHNESARKTESFSIEVICRGAVSNAPMSGAQITLSANRNIIDSKVTDQSGRALFYAVPKSISDQLSLTASAEGYQPNCITVNSRARIVEMILTGTGSVSGAVTDTANGDPIPNASVTLTDYHGYSTQTDDDGRYNLISLPLAKVQEIAFEKQGFVRRTAEVTVQRQTTLNVTLQAIEQTTVVLHFPNLQVSKQEFIANVSIISNASAEVLFGSQLQITNGHSQFQVPYTKDHLTAHVSFHSGRKLSASTTPVEQSEALFAFFTFDSVPVIQLRFLDRVNEPIVKSLVFCMPALPDRLSETLMTDSSGVASMLRPHGNTHARFVFWSKHGVSEPADIQCMTPQPLSIVLADYGGDIYLRHTGELSEISVEGRQIGEYFWREQGDGVVHYHVPQGRYRILHGRHPITDYSINIEPGLRFEVSLDDLLRTGALKGKADPGVEVKLLTYNQGLSVISRVLVPSTRDFSFERVAPGEYLVVASYGPSECITRKVKVVGDEIVNVGEFLQEQLTRIYLQLMYSDREPAAELRISLKPIGPRSYATDLVTDEQGRAEYSTGSDGPLVLNCGLGFCSFDPRESAQPGVVEIELPQRKGRSTLCLPDDIDSLRMIWIDARRLAYTWFCELLPRGPARFQMPDCVGHQYFVVPAKKQTYILEEYLSPGKREYTLRTPSQRVLDTTNLPAGAIFSRLGWKRIGKTDVALFGWKTARKTIDERPSFRLPSNSLFELELSSENQQETWFFDVDTSRPSGRIRVPKHIPKALRN